MAYDLSLASPMLRMEAEDSEENQLPEWIRILKKLSGGAKPAGSNHE